MNSTLDQAERKFLEELRKLRSATVSDICDAIGVTATAVRQRLTPLQARGLIEREEVKTGRGRPHHTYKISDEGSKALGNNYGELALVLWRELSKIDNPTVKEELVKSLKASLVERYGNQVDGVNAEERMEQLRETLVSKGFNVEIDTVSELPVLRENNCPYLELASNDPSICELEKTVFEEILGANVKLTQCCLDGHSCCEFEVTQLEENIPAHSIENV